MVSLWGEVAPAATEPAAYPMVVVVPAEATPVAEFLRVREVTREELVLQEVVEAVGAALS